MSRSGLPLQFLLNFVGKQSCSTIHVPCSEILILITPQRPPLVYSIHHYQPPTYHIADKNSYSLPSLLPITQFYRNDIPSSHHHSLQILRSQDLKLTSSQILNPASLFKRNPLRPLMHILN